MTDNEIIKALGCCISTGTALDCFKCPMAENRVCYGSNTKVSQLVVKNALSLIKSQKAEIERLQQKYELSEAEREANVKGFTESLATAKSEARNEFAEKLKAKAYTNNYCQEIVLTDDIDNLVKEMKEDEGK